MKPRERERERERERKKRTEKEGGIFTNEGRKNETGRG
jgi:hypothetical protein